MRQYHKDFFSKFLLLFMFLHVHVNVSNGCGRGKGGVSGFLLAWEEGVWFGLPN